MPRNTPTPLKTHYALLVVMFAAIALAACKPSNIESAEPLNVYDLRLPEDGFEGIQRLEYKSVVLDDGGEAANNIVQGLRGQQITSTAYYKYWMQPTTEAPKPYYKVKLNIFSSADAAIKAWDGRYPPEALRGTRSVGLGDVSYELPDKIVGWRDDNIVVELSAHGGAGQLVPFASAYAAFVATVKQRHKSG